MNEKIKKPNAGHFKKKSVVLENEKILSDEAAAPESSVTEFAQVLEEKKEIDVRGLVRDLMFNKYFHIMEKEAKPIAEKMVKDGSSSLHEVKWFLAYSERVQLARELAEKYGLN